MSGLRAATGGVDPRARGWPGAVRHERRCSDARMGPRSDGSRARTARARPRAGVRARSLGAREHVWWRPRRRSWWMAVLFAVGSLCFLGAGIASQWGGGSTSAIGITFFVGSIFFTCCRLPAVLRGGQRRSHDHRRLIAGLGGGRLRGNRANRLAGGARSVDRDDLLQHQHVCRDERQPEHAPDQRARVGARRVRFNCIPRLKRSGIRRGLSSLGLLPRTGDCRGGSSR